MLYLICIPVFGVIAFLAYRQSKKYKEVNEINKSRIWMIVSIVTGAITVFYMLAAISSVLS